MPDESDNWGYTQAGLKHYTAHRAVGPITIDGRPDEETWQLAPRSPRFEDLVDARPGLFDTRASIVWDDDCLYVAFWVEEPNLEVRRHDITVEDLPEGQFDLVHTRWLLHHLPQGLV